MILHIVRNPVTHDSRILKETRTLQDSGIFGSVEIAGFLEHGHTPYEELEDGRAIWRASIATRPLPKDLGSQAVKFMEWYARVVQRYRRMRIKVIHCHDLAPLPIALGLKRLTGARVVYDAHELETERAGSQGPRRLLACSFEQNMIKSVDAMITVSPSIRDRYAARYPDVPVSLVRNVPEKPSNGLKLKPLRTQFQVPDSALLFIYLGGLPKGRGG